MEGGKNVPNEASHIIQCQLGNKEDIFCEYFVCCDVASGEHLNISDAILRTLTLGVKLLSSTLYILIALFCTLTLGVKLLCSIL